MPVSIVVMEERIIHNIIVVIIVVFFLRGIVVGKVNWLVMMFFSVSYQQLGVLMKRRNRNISSGVHCSLICNVNS